MLCSALHQDGACVFWDPPHDCRATAKNASLGAPPAVSGAKHTLVGDEADLLAAVALQPVAAAIYTGMASFTTYSGGVYDDEGCHGVTADKLDHAVLIVGFGTEKGKDYFLVKNSWGPKWGERGFVKMARGVKGAPSGMCGIAIDASYPLV
jgi:cathepsin L